MTHIPDLRRRSFLVGGTAAGLAFGYVAVHGISDALAAGKFEPTAWYSIAPDGRVTVMVGKAEMGQHVSSAMAQIVAEELEADWNKMRIALPDNDPKYNDPVLGALITGGSWSVRMNFDAMSRAGAAGRITLIDAGAAMMGVPAGECRASNSQVIHTKTGKKVVPPVRYGAKVAAVDDSAAKQVKGFVKAVTLDDKTGTTTGWVVAVATTYANARKAANALKISYDNGPNAKLSSESLLNEARRLQGLDDSGLFFVKDGDTAAAFGTAAKVMEAEYTTSINIHAPLEPMNATAQLQGDIWHIYSGNQFATRSGAIAAGAAGVDPKFVVMHQMWLGGGFGRRLDADMMVPAVQAAKAVGKPVKVIYSRENDMTMDYSRPLTFQKVKAGV